MRDNLTRYFNAVAGSASLVLPAVDPLDLRTMNDQHVTAIATIVQAVLLLVSAFLIAWYLYETRLLRKAAENQVEAGLRQVEASFRPALIVTHAGSMHDNPLVENIGQGPAMEVEWVLRESTVKGKFPYLRLGPPQFLPCCSVKDLFEAAATCGPDVLTAVIECRYRSLSGRRYSSTSTCNLETLQFTTTFSDS